MDVRTNVCSSFSCFQGGEYVEVQYTRIEDFKSKDLTYELERRILRLATLEGEEKRPGSPSTIEVKDEHASRNGSWDCECLNLNSTVKRGQGAKRKGAGGLAFR